MGPAVPKFVAAVGGAVVHSFFSHWCFLFFFVFGHDIGAMVSSFVHGEVFLVDFVHQEEISFEVIIGLFHFGAFVKGVKDLVQDPGIADGCGGLPK